MKVIIALLLIIIICFLAVIIVLMIVPNDMVYSDDMILFRFGSNAFGFMNGEFVNIENVNDIEWNLIESGSKILNFFENIFK